MNKIEISICAGTACYILGGAELLLLEEKLPPDLKDKVIISGLPCLDLCKNDEGMRPPFVKINGKVLEQANYTSIIEEIKSILS